MEWRKHLRIHGYVIDVFNNERWACRDTLSKTFDHGGTAYNHISRSHGQACLDDDVYISYRFYSEETSMENHHTSVEKRLYHVWSATSHSHGESIQHSTHAFSTTTGYITQTLTNLAGAISVSVSNFHQHVRSRLIALASRNGAAHWRCLESSDDCAKGQHVSFHFSEPVERAEFHEIHANVDSVVSKNLVE